MRKNLSRANPPISDVVIAFQPRQLGKSYMGMEPGRVALFRYGDTRSRLFDCEGGACWVEWRNAELDRQLEWMIQFKKELVREWGVSPSHAEGVFRQCPEFRAMRRRQRLAKDRQTKRELLV